MASRIAARSTIAGTPVKSCMMTRAGVNEISYEGGAFGSQFSSASISARVTLVPSSKRSKFSSRILSEYGKRATFSTPSAGKLQMS